jgi:hypothetical protein
MQASMGLICRWKAPWVRLIVSFFAEGCLKRPWWARLRVPPRVGSCNVLACRVQWVEGTPAGHHNELATEGVRADRVGAKPPL